MTNLEENKEQPFGNLINPYTNKPVQTGKSISFNQRIYDDKNYIQAKNDLIDDFNSRMTQPKNINQKAIYDIPVVPEFLQKEYSDAYSSASWLDGLNIATPDEIDEWRAKGKIGIGETARRLASLKSAKYIPFVGTTADVGYNLDMLHTMNRMKKGQSVSDTEKDLLVDYLRELKEIQVRGTTLPSKTLSAILESIPYFAEFGIGVAAAPETFGGSLSASGLALSKAAGKKAARKAVDKALKAAAVESTMTGVKKAVPLSAAKSLYKTTYNDMLKAGSVKAASEVGAKEAAKITLQNTPKNIATAAFGSKPLSYMTLKNTVGGVADRQLSGSVYVTDAGEAVFQQPENLALSIMKSFSSSVFDNYTETMGWAFAPVASYFAKPLKNVLPKKFFTEFEKVVSSRFGMPATQALKKFGYDGVIEEMGEELLNRFLCQTFGVNGLDDYDFDGFMNNVFYANDPEQWLVELASFSIMGGAAHGAIGAGGKINEKITDIKNNKEVEKLAKLSNNPAEFYKRVMETQHENNLQDLVARMNAVEEFYLNQGLVKIDGSQSSAEQMLRKKFSESGIDEATANEFFEGASELEVREKLKDYLEAENGDAEKRREKTVDFLAAKMAENEGYSDSKKTKANANLIVTALEKLSETTGQSIEDVIKDEAPKIIQTDKEMSIGEDEVGNRSIDARLKELENEIFELTWDEDKFDEERFNAVSEEYNELEARKQQGETLYQTAQSAGAENGEYADALKEWKEKGTDSKYFKKWFGDSKVVDTEGKPLVVYHRTKNEFDTFDNQKITSSNLLGKGFYFSETDSKNAEQSFGKIKMPVYIKAENPLNDTTIIYKNQLEKYFEQNILDELFGSSEEIDGGKFLYLMMLRKTENGQNIDTTEILKELGYDSIHAEAFGNWVVFSPEQIKSVNNQGTFDAKNPNIYKQEDFSPIVSGKITRVASDEIELNNELWLTNDFMKKQGYPVNDLRLGKTVIIDTDRPFAKDIDFSVLRNDIEEKPLQFNTTPVNADVEKIAKKYFGTTANLKEAGYILADGSLLDLSGKKFGGTAGTRSLDHREISDAFEDADYNVDLNDFVDNGAIRYMPEANAFLIARMPSEQQFAAMKKIISKNNGAVSLELVENMNKWGNDKNFRKEYEEFSKPEKILEDVKTYFNGGKISEFKKYYQAVYHGTPHRFDEFSTENIGTGEGAFVHGWGLYFTSDKNIANERYRKRLSGGFVMPTYNGKQISQKDNELYTSIEISGKEKLINRRKNTISDYEEYLKKEDLSENSREWANTSLRENQEEIKKINEFDKSKYIKGHWEQEYLFDGKPLSIKEAEEYDERDLLDYLNQEIERVNSNIEKLKANVKADIKNGELFKDAYNLIKNKKEITTNSQLFKVDIPENKFLLDEQKTIYKQNKNIRTAVINALTEAGLKRFTGVSALSQLTGEDVYNMIVPEVGKSPKNASLLLLKHGIKGIKYNGKTDGECYVIFDDKAVKVLEKYYQEAEQQNIFPGNRAAKGIRNIKGAYVPAENLIELFKGADESTIIHEFAHWWLERLDKYAEKNEELAADLDAVRKFVKNDGGEFTQEQHEKFARGFEAYIRNGSARNNRLKKIFEDFKNALLAIYDNLKQIMYVEDGEYKTFSEDDVKTLENLFERLLTTENQRIQDKVFNKCNEIDEKIKEIKENEKKEVDEIRKLYRGNEAVLNRESDKKRKIEEYLELADKAASREPKEMKDFKKRYKDATFQILETATGKPRTWLANPRNSEKLQEIIGNLDDEITIQGFDPSWSEFYSDTGVTYNNDEVDGDYKLAEQAYNVMVDGRYRYEDTENEEINDFFKKFNYLQAKVMTLKGEEKNVACEALSKVLSKMPAMPDEAVQEVVKKFQEITWEKEQQQENDFARVRYPSISVTQQLQWIVTKKLNDLKIYNPEMKYKTKLNKSHRLYNLIQGATSVNTTENAIRKINSYIIDDLQNNQKALLHKEIQKQVRVNSKVVKVGNKRVGKFDWKTNTVFARLVELNKMTRSSAVDMYRELVNADTIVSGEMRETKDDNLTDDLKFTDDFQKRLEKQFTVYKATCGRGTENEKGGSFKDLDYQATRKLLENILKLKFEGRRAKSDEDFIRKTQEYNYKNNLVEIVEESRNNGAAKYAARWIAGDTIFTSEGTLANWESILNTVFNKETAQKYSLLNLEAQTEVYARERMKELYDRAGEIYGFKNPNFIDKISDFDNTRQLVDLMRDYKKQTKIYRSATHDINNPSKNVEYMEKEISKAQIITYFAWSLNEQLEQRIMTEFGAEQVMDMFSQLSIEDKQFARALIDICESMYNDINEVFIRTTGLSLPRSENYFPSKAERCLSDLDMLQEALVRTNDPSFNKERKVCNRIQMQSLDPFEIIVPHINKAARYVILSEKLNYLNKLFTSVALKNKMQSVYGNESGQKIYKVMLNQLHSLVFSNYSKGLCVAKSFADTLANNFVVASIGGNGKVMYSQLLSVINYAENMPAHVWAKGFAKNLLHPKETIKFMMDNCPYLQSRLAGNSQNEVMVKITEEMNLFRNMKNFFTSNTKYGDIAAIIFGGKPYVDYLISTGMSKEDAFTDFVESTLRSQQSGHMSATSIWQKAVASQTVSRMIFAFNNTNMQYERKWVDSISQFSKGEIDTQQFIKAILIYKVLNPILFTSVLGNMAVISLVRSVLGGDDDARDMWKDPAFAILAGGLGGYGYLGLFAKSIIAAWAAVATDSYYFKTNIPVLNDVEDVFYKLFNKGSKGTLTIDDYIDIIATGANVASIPGKRFANAIGGIGDIANGELGVGLSRIQGWGNRTSKKAWTREDK